MIEDVNLSLVFTMPKSELILIIAFSFIIGGYFGSKYAVSLKPDMLKRIFGIIMLIASFKMIFSK